MTRTLDSLIIEAEQNGFTIRDLIDWSRSRQGFNTRAVRRERLRATEGYRHAMAKASGMTGVPAEEIDGTGRAAEIVSARDIVIDVLGRDGWRPTDIACVLDKHHASIHTAQQRIERRRMSEARRLKVVR
jgi:hypothetical protein